MTEVILLEDLDRILDGQDHRMGEESVTHGEMVRMLLNKTGGYNAEDGQVIVVTCNDHTVFGRAFLDRCALRLFIGYHSDDVWRRFFARAYDLDVDDAWIASVVGQIRVVEASWSERPRISILHMQNVGGDRTRLVAEMDDIYDRLMETVDED